MFRPIRVAALVAVLAPWAMAVPMTQASSVTTRPQPTFTAGEGRSASITPAPRVPGLTLTPVTGVPALGMDKGAAAPVFRGGRRPRAAAPTAHVPAAPLTRRPAAPQVALFGGLTKAGIAAADNGAPIPTPPDSTGAIGPNNYVEISNSVIHVWDRNLNTVSSATISVFLGGGSPWCDPQMQWDQTAQRWLFSVLYCNTVAVTPQLFAIGWSKTSDPTNLTTTGGSPGWCAFQVSTSDNVNTTFADLFDYDKLGHNANYMIVGGNFYDVKASLTTPPFVTAAIAWIQLPANGDTSCNPPNLNSTRLAAHALKDGDGITDAFTPVPVNTDTAAGDGYVVSAYDPAGNVGNPGFQSKLAVWHVDAGGTLHQDPDVSVISYGAPPAAPQMGNSFLIDTMDGRLTQAVGDPLSGIWTQHTVKNGGVSMVAWYELGLSGGALYLVQQGTISNFGDFLYNGAISPSLNAHGAAIVYNRTSATMHPVIEVQVRSTGTPLGQMDPGPLTIVSSPGDDHDSSCNFKGSGSPCRWGDYAGASPDPNQPYVVWGTSEAINAAAPADTSPHWQNWNFAVYATARDAAVQIGSGPQSSRNTGANQAPAGTPSSR